MKFFTGKGVSFVVSDEDAARVAAHRWHLVQRGYISTNMRDGKRWRSVRLHRWLLGVIDANLVVDHVNGDPTDNRRENLRICSREQNAYNQAPKRGCASPFKGVASTGRINGKPWRANIRGRVLGHYATDVEAALAYDAAAREEYGEFARLNFPEVNAPFEGTAGYQGRCLWCDERFEGKTPRRKFCSKLHATLHWQKTGRLRNAVNMISGEGVTT